jgi:hypothetical protein
MWSFDRYGRWIEQRTEWALTDTPSAPQDQRSAAPTEEAMDLAELTELVDRLEKRGH